MDVPDKPKRVSNNRKKLSESEKRFRAAVSSTADLIWEGDVRDDSLEWFGDIDGCLGYEPGEFPRTVSGHMVNIHCEDIDDFKKEVDLALKTGQDFQTLYRMKCRDGTYRFWEERGKAVCFEKGRAVKWVGAITDVTERHLIEKKLISSEGKCKVLSQEFNALLDAIPDDLILLTPDMNISWANRAFALKHDKTVSELYGNKCYQLCCNITSPCKNCPVITCFRSGKEEITRVTNSEGRMLDKRAYPVKNEEGKVVNVIEVARDVTAKVRMEEESKLIQSKLIHTNKMTSLGILVSGVAHEINNPNSFILHNTITLNKIWNDTIEILSQYYNEKGDFKLAGLSFSELQTLIPDLLNGINEGSSRIKNIVENLRNYTRPDQTLNGEEVDVNSVIMSSRAILNNHIKKYTYNFHIQCDDNIAPIRGSKQKLEQVCINIIMNALQAMRNKESGIRITTSNNKRSGTVVIKVEDEGIGMSKEILKRITEPFFTTRLNNGGTGLGLSISNAIVKEHSGTLSFKSTEGAGTSVMMNFPAIKRRISN